MKADFFKNNRKRLVDFIGDGPIIITAYKEVQRNSDSAWRFEQEANFWYLTGIEKADWICVINENVTTLIYPEISEISQVFNGQLDFGQALVVSGADKVLSPLEGQEFIDALSRKYKEVRTIGPQNQNDYDFHLNPSQIELHRNLTDNFLNVVDIRKDILKLRAIKQKEEIIMLRRAVDLTKPAFVEVKPNISQYDFEYQIQAEFTYRFQKANADHAYDPIVASGKNAVTLHYCSNQAALAGDNMVLIDIGARYGGYSADITRTYENGEASKRQRLIHDAVRVAKDEIVALIRPGLLIRDYITESDRIMKDTLKSVNLMNSDVDFRRYFPHAVSHGLGIETHDTLGGFDHFKPGMVLTVEPGIYSLEESIGVRIEDDILVTDDGNENLSASLSDGF